MINPLRSKSIVAVKCGLLLLTLAMIPIGASKWERSSVARADTRTVSANSDYIAGVVTSSKGPEAGVWVIAETTDLPTKFRKIVVTNDAGRYVLPELPKATYKVWVRGYGLVDSKPLTASPGDTLPLTAVIAPDARAAAQYYPADYWYSLLNMPPKSAFPMKVRSSADIKVVRVYGETGEKEKTQAATTARFRAPRLRRRPSGLFF